MKKLPKKLHKKLNGSWVSCRKKTIQFNDKNAKMPKKASKLFNQMIGNMTLTYDTDRGTLRTQFREYEVETKNGKHTFEKSDSTDNYKVLGFTDDSIVFETDDFILGKMIFTIHFEGKNHYWIYLAEGVSGLHGREYFKKLKKQ